MDIVDIKKELSIVYERSLNVEVVSVDHPIRLVQAVKSLIGIKVDRPLVKLLDFTKDYVEKCDCKCIEVNFDHSIPRFVSYKALEEALLQKDTEQSYKCAYDLSRVSEGRQIVEFLLEYCLKNNYNAFLFVWSVFKMTLFLNNQFLLKSIYRCIDVIAINEKFNVNGEMKIKIDSEYFHKYSCEVGKYEEYCILSAIYFEELIRSDKIQAVISNKVAKFSKKIEERNDFVLKSSQVEMGREWVNEFLYKIDSKKLTYELILFLDASRAVLKVTSDKNIDSKHTWNSFNNNLQKYSI